MFDRSHPYLDLLTFLSDLLFKFTGEMWGDRAIFARSEILKDPTLNIDVPIMEDFILSRFMRKKGRVIMLKEKVVTSSGTFLKNGMLWNTIRIIKCRLWFALGGNLQKIYNYYYT